MRPVEVNDPRAPFVQIADDLRTQIQGGELTQGARLPSSRMLARDYGVALMTAQSALQRLRDEGHVYSTARGYFVGSPLQPQGANDGEPSSLAQRLEEVETEVRELRSRVEALESGQ